MSAVLDDIPQALAATAGPAGLIPVAFEGRSLQRTPPGPHRLPAPAGPQRPRLAPRGLPDRRLLLGRRIRRQRPRGPRPLRRLADRRRRRHPPRRRHRRPARRSQSTGAEIRVRRLRRHRTVSARDTFSSLKLERALSDQGIPLFATDEPFNVAGINATTILVRRVKQGVAEWYRFQLREKVWAGLREHSLAGWNLGKVPTGYLRGKTSAPQPDQGRRRPHQNPADPRPRLRPRRRPDLPVASDRPARQADDLAAAGREPAPVPRPAVRGLVAGPGR